MLEHQKDESQIDLFLLLSMCEEYVDKYDNLSSNTGLEPALLWIHTDNWIEKCNNVPVFILVKNNY